MQVLYPPYSLPIVSHLFCLFDAFISHLTDNLLSVSANPSLHTANAEIISLISSFALAQEAYNSALERGETPPPPVLARERDLPTFLVYLHPRQY